MYQSVDLKFLTNSSSPARILLVATPWRPTSASNRMSTAFESVEMFGCAAGILGSDRGDDDDDAHVSPFELACVIKVSKIQCAFCASSGFDP